MKDKRRLSVRVIGVIAVILLFIIPFLVLQRRADVLNRENAELRADLAAAQANLEFYRASFEETLEDIRILSSAFDVTGRYENLARSIRERELGSLSNETITLRNPGLWREYEKKRIINASCLFPFSIETIDEIVQMEIIAEGEPILYIDGNSLGPVSNVSVGMRLSPGEHEISFLSPTGAQVRSLSLDGRAIDLSSATADSGEGWQVFDCQGAQQGNGFFGAGAVRVLVEKQ